MKRRIAIVEDNRYYRDGLELLLSQEPDFEVATCVDSAEPLLAMARVAAADRVSAPWSLVVMDIELPGANGIDATRELKALFPELHVMVVTSFEEPSRILAAIVAGADGYIVKRADLEEILDELRTVVAGGAPMTPGVARTVMSLLRENSPSAPPLPAKTLTDRELDVLRCLVKGASYKIVAVDLDMSLDTVRTHVRSIYRKLQVHNVAEAVSKALKQRIV
ncbi:MAG: response regulator transcription factor [Acidobacteriota bacterium]